MNQVKKIKAFEKFLSDKGCQILPKTNDYELVRFECQKGVGVVYTNKWKDKVSFSDKWVEEALNCFVNSKPWNFGGEKKKRKNTSRQKQALINRDGCKCFYCGKEFDESDLTQEHLLSIKHGGVNRIENKVLACNPCNSEVGSLPIIDKIKFRDGKING